MAGEAARRSMLDGIEAVWEEHPEQSLVGMLRDVGVGSEGFMAPLTDRQLLSSLQKQFPAVDRRS